jgi:hypothetical protein
MVSAEDGPHVSVCFLFIHCFSHLTIYKSTNIFDSLPALAPPKATDLRNELDRYLGTDVENVTDAVAWWHAHHSSYPQLSQMALDYLTIPGKLYSAS